ncbi:MAG TPA: hypothetical protein VLA93_14250 [Pyrinomonadaceae bacterium]|nr:hypothetical protein [Pyrinomonadaceae bacterium]
MQQTDKVKFIEHQGPVEDNSAASREELPQVDSAFGPFRLQPDTELNNASSYALTDLLNYHDKRFVLNAYAAIAKRPPSASELTQTLQELRGGLRTKTEIVEQLSAKYPDVRVVGLPSPLFRQVSRWPVIGHALTVLRAIGRLPLLVQHQQQFESYIVGQQQRVADHINGVLLATDTGSELSTPQSDVAENVSDVIKTVMMLSDSLVELSANLADGEARLQTLQTQHERLESEFRTNLEAVSEQLTTSAQQIQKQHEQSEGQLHSDLVALTRQLTVQQEQLDEIRRTADAAATSQREFLIDEQRMIVEAQRAALSDLEEQFTKSSREQAEKIKQLTAELHELRAAVKKFQQAGSRK